MKITLIAGARPNFMKVAPIITVIQKAKDERTHRHGPCGYQTGIGQVVCRRVEERCDTGVVGRTHS